ncbi:MAG: SagB/ThcOx family dehydrogenase [Clostridia bacterium]
MKGQGQFFMEYTKYKYLEDSDQVKGLPQPPLVLGKENPENEVIELPDPNKVKVNKKDITDVINDRVSVRAYADENLALGELSYLLWVTQGIKYISKRPATLRTVPSAGCRHPFETYLLINRVEGLKKGLYKYLPMDHELEVISLEDGIDEKIKDSCYKQVMVVNSGVTFIWTAVRYRNYWRYGERGYRYVHLDAGHVAQNLYLASDVVDCGVCGIAAFYDDEINSIIGIDGVERYTAYVATCGKKRK